MNQSRIGIINAACISEWHKESRVGIVDNVPVSIVGYLKCEYTHWLEFGKNSYHGASKKKKKEEKEHSQYFHHKAWKDQRVKISDLAQST